MKTIYLAGGCFWGVQKFLDQFEGIQATEVGYANGGTKDPTYEEVCAGSGHAETVRVDYDETIISLPELLGKYFLIIDPTSVNKQGNDTGIQYRTGIYYTDPADEGPIRAFLESEQSGYVKPLAVEMLPLKNYYPAEEYHQKYLNKNPGGYCHIPSSMMNL